MVTVITLIEKFQERDMTVCKAKEMLQDQMVKLGEDKALEKFLRELGGKRSTKIIK